MASSHDELHDLIVGEGLLCHGEGGWRNGRRKLKLLPVDCRSPKRRFSLAENKSTGGELQLKSRKKRSLTVSLKTRIALSPESPPYYLTSFHPRNQVIFLLRLFFPPIPSIPLLNCTLPIMNWLKSTFVSPYIFSSAADSPLALPPLPAPKNRPMAPKPFGLSPSRPSRPPIPN